MLCFSQLKIDKRKITIKLELEVIDKKPFLNDAIYVCKKDINVRLTKDTVYVYGKNQYLKLKR